MQTQTLDDLRQKRIIHFAQSPSPPPPPPPETLAQHAAFPLLPGELNLLVGIPGVGKSSLAIDLAVRAALGRPYPPASDQLLLHPSHAQPAADNSKFLPGEIFYAAAEYHGHFTHLTDLGIPFEMLLLPRHHEALVTQPPVTGETSYQRKQRRENPYPILTFLENHRPFYNFRLLILDPLHAFVDSISASPSTLRKALLPLINFAQQRGCAILAVNHLSKARGTLRKHADIADNILGSLAFSAYARSILFLTHDQHNPARRLLFHVKNNTENLAAPMAFTLHRRPLPPDAKSNKPLPPILQWEQNPLIDHPLCHQRLCDTAEPELDPRLLRKSQLDLACDFLTYTLKDGPRPSQQVLKEARAIAISPTTLTRARLYLGIDCYPDGKQWFVKLPQNDPDSHPQSETKSGVP